MRTDAAGRILRSLSAVMLAAALACADSPTAPGGAEPPQTSALAVSVFLPVPLSWQVASRAEDFRAALRAIRSAIPAVTMVGLFLRSEGSGESDWVALLDVARQEQFQIVIGFADVVSGQAERGFRPTLTSGHWQLGSLGAFFSCAACVGHSALYAVLALDEPWHPSKRPFYTTADLQSLYATLHALAPAATTPRVMLAFSRQIWKQMNSATAHYEAGMADVVQISALEFQDGTYQFDQLDQNHYWSRRIVREKTPDVPLWSTVQVMGGKLGPHAGYWFPRAEDLTRLLEDLMAAKYENEYALTGIALQKWDSEDVAARASQFTLGDRYLAGQPADQSAASAAAIAAINSWLASLRR